MQSVTSKPQIDNIEFDWYKRPMHPERELPADTETEQNIAEYRRALADEFAQRGFSIETLKGIENAACTPVLEAEQELHAGQLIRFPTSAHEFHSTQGLGEGYIGSFAIRVFRNPPTPVSVVLTYDRIAIELRVEGKHKTALVFDLAQRQAYTTNVLSDTPFASQHVQRHTELTVRNTQLIPYEVSRELPALVQTLTHKPNARASSYPNPDAKRYLRWSHQPQP